VERKAGNWGSVEGRSSRSGTETELKVGTGRELLQDGNCDWALSFHQFYFIPLRSIFLDTYNMNES
jgi:hypothetical protein